MISTLLRNLKMKPDVVSQLTNLRSKINFIRSETRTFMERKDQELATIQNELSEIIGGKRSLSTENDWNSSSSSSKKIKSENVDFAFNGGQSKLSTDSDNHFLKKIKKDIPAFDADRSRFVTIDDFVHVYTDGACPDNGKAGAKAGIGVWWNHDHTLNISRRVVGSKQTNNVAEIQAISMALTQAITAGVPKLQVNTDSQFVINSVTQWIPGWKNKGWRTASGQEVKNKDDFIELDKIMQQKGSMEIRWNHVKGHSDVEGNIEADKLAVAGAKMK